MAVSKRLRYEIMLRDNHTCRYCGASAPDVPMTIDHVVPKTLGGGDEPSNLVAACRDCNSGKSSSTATAAQVEDVAADAVRWAAAMKQAGDLRSAETEAEQELLDDFECMWTTTWLKDPRANDTSSQYRHPGRRYAPRPHDWGRSILKFVSSGLDMRFLGTAKTRALNNEKIAWDESWRYFCGICWRELDDRRKIAQAILHAEEAE